ncbi:MAG: MerR family transcriptional regulator [Nitrospiraceae bacterium]|nr:MerR family transcriptional regulator [Nitrospiraceae bacterium]
MQKARASKNSPEQKKFPDKLFYKIGEVSRLTKVESYVLRYWETEFPFLRPRKNKSGQRVYIRKDLDLILRIKELLYDQKYTIEGVRLRLETEGTREPKEVQEDNENAAISPGSLQYIKNRLREILQQF